MKKLLLLLTTIIMTTQEEIEQLKERVLFLEKLIGRGPKKSVKTKRQEERMEIRRRIFKLPPYNKFGVV